MTGPDRRLGGRERSLLPVLLVASLLGVAALTLSPVGTGRAWGAPLSEVLWYADASAEARRQLLGNLLLLVPSAAAAVLLWPWLARRHCLWRTALAAGTTLELLQWTLPLGRVVSPVDAVLNATGALAAGLLVRQVLPVLSALRRSGDGVDDRTALRPQRSCERASTAPGRLDG